MLRNKLVAGAVIISVVVVVVISAYYSLALASLQDRWLSKLVGSQVD